MYTDWIGWRGRRGDELPAAGGAARFKPDQGVEARPLRATNAITNRKLEMVFECARASCGIVRHAALRSKPKATKHYPTGPPPTMPPTRRRSTVLALCPAAGGPRRGRGRCRAAPALPPAGGLPASGFARCAVRGLRLTPRTWRLAHPERGARAAASGVWERDL